MRILDLDFYGNKPKIPPLLFLPIFSKINCPMIRNRVGQMWHFVLCQEEDTTIERCRWPSNSKNAIFPPFLVTDYLSILHNEPLDLRPVRKTFMPAPLLRWHRLANFVLSKELVFVCARFEMGNFGKKLQCKLRHYLYHNLLRDLVTFSEN
jgi:hypothetical protein